MIRADRHSARSLKRYRLNNMAELTETKLAIFDLGNVVFRVDWQPMFDIWSEAPDALVQRTFETNYFE